VCDPGSGWRTRTVPDAGGGEAIAGRSRYNMQHYSRKFHFGPKFRGHVWALSARARDRFHLQGRVAEGQTWSDPDRAPQPKDEFALKFVKP
jgi:hypothetical protein